MQKEYISVIEFCANNNIELEFINMLHQNGLIELTTIEEIAFVNSKQIPQIERIVRLHYDLDINIEGIETINYLLEKIDSLQNEITRLKNSLRLYEKVAKIQSVKARGNINR